MKRPLKAQTLVEYRDARVVDSPSNGRRGRIVRVCSKQGGAYQYVVEIISCPDNWKPEHKAQQIGKAHFWWEADFTIVNERYRFALVQAQTDVTADVEVLSRHATLGAAHRAQSAGNALTFLIQVERFPVAVGQRISRDQSEMFRWYDV